jgi:hypothetical protein
VTTVPKRQHTWILRGLAGIGAVAILAYVLLRGEGRRAALGAAAPEAPQGLAAGSLHVTRSEVVRPLALPDPAHVDILEAYVAAKAAALEIQPGAELFGISGGAFVGGTHDLTKARDSLDAGPAMPLLVQFEYVGDSKGKGGVKRHVEVRVARDGLHITTVDGAVPSHESQGRSLAALAEPSCSSRKAWATAVDSGVPEGVEATLLLHTEHERLGVEPMGAQPASASPPDRCEDVRPRFPRDGRGWPARAVTSARRPKP